MEKIISRHSAYFRTPQNHLSVNGQLLECFAQKKKKEKKKKADMTAPLNPGTEHQVARFASPMPLSTYNNLVLDLEP